MIIKQNWAIHIIWLHHRISIFNGASASIQRLVQLYTCIDLLMDY
jgi:hypothetical protein